MSKAADENAENQGFAPIDDTALGGDGQSEARRILDEQIKAQLEVSQHFRAACGKVSERLLKELNVELAEAPTPEEAGLFEVNALLKAEDGRAIAECRVFTGVNGVAYFVGAGAPPQELDSATPERLEEALTAFSERALKSNAA